MENKQIITFPVGVIISSKKQGTGRLKSVRFLFKNTLKDVDIALH